MAEVVERTIKNIVFFLTEKEQKLAAKIWFEDMKPSDDAIINMFQINYLLSKSIGSTIKLTQNKKYWNIVIPENFEEKFAENKSWINVKENLYNSLKYYCNQDKIGISESEAFEMCDAYCDDYQIFLERIYTNLSSQKTEFGKMLKEQYELPLSKKVFDTSFFLSYNANIFYSNFAKQYRIYKSESE
jgi:hypothetical protein